VTTPVGSQVLLRSSCVKRKQMAAAGSRSFRALEVLPGTCAVLRSLCLMTTFVFGRIDPSANGLRRSTRSRFMTFLMAHRLALGYNKVTDATLKLQHPSNLVSSRASSSFEVIYVLGGSEADLRWAVCRHC
jgi:hypothetical protein